MLRIGVLRPSAADATGIASSIVAGAQLAVEEMTAAGMSVEMIVRNEGDDAVTTGSIEELVDAGVSAIIGPMSSNVALSTLARIIEHRVVACSPTATTLALDDFPDSGLFFRTIPSDAVQAAAVARLVDRTGARTAAVLYIDDNYGRPLADAVQRIISQQVPVTRIGFDGSEAAITDLATRLAVDPPGTVVVIADPKSGPPVIDAVDAALGSRTRTFVVNDALRRAFVGTSTSARIIGASVHVMPPDSELERLRALAPTVTGAFAPYAYDCAMLIGLASTQRSSTLPLSIAAEMTEASVGGSVCTTFAECLALIDDGRNIDYRGMLGTADLAPDGDAITGEFDSFEIRDGNDETTGSFLLNR